ncbi:hypothetical protein SLE2022_032290 [Rubroshorea leprosula]
MKGTKASSPAPVPMSMVFRRPPTPFDRSILRLLAYLEVMTGVQLKITCDGGDTTWVKDNLLLLLDLPVMILT